ncbi:mannitol 1-phosphate dehydrogenase [Hypoxylon trugodes]|uniref:mannitol 1-phosphate dehydrogenase n=1 Tax=Hypoxylon trugodes TaxID=326681 RepID=UPI0021918B71|nr:mannitol 1-phosphate dehydrogenase [Hypoxylon trugodes]KAI1390333.1 mannitol 1-phosphate dehydrogenase [Hypoxylon trugodes]
MESPVQAPPKIAILGAGIAGLAVAIGLIKRNVPVTVYEAADRFSVVGAGIGLGPNAMNAMDLINPNFREKYEKVKTRNERPEFENSIFDALYAEDDFGARRGWTRGLIGAPYFTRSSAHRKDLLDIMESFIPEGTVRFGKRAQSIEQVENHVLVGFEDGTTETFDAVIGCDGVKGISRRAILGDIAPEEVQPAFCGMYIYRGIIPMEQAKEILGVHAGDAKFFMADGKGVAIYPISQGREENFVFFVLTPDPWTHGDVAIPCKKEDMIKDLEGFDSRLLKLLDYARPLRWPTWHHPKTSTFYKGRVCLLGDVAHACAPHQAAGAGQGLEDAALLSQLIALVETPDEFDVAFQVYDAVRRPRAQRAVLTSFEAGLLYTWQHPEIGGDMQKIAENANQRLHWIWQYDLEADIRKASEDFRKLVLQRRDTSRDGNTTNLNELGSLGRIKCT